MIHDQERVIEETQLRVQEFYIMQNHSPEFLKQGEEMAAALNALAERLFTCQDGEPRAFHEEGKQQFVYVSYVRGHRGYEDRRADLVAMLEETLNNLKGAGATRIVWRSKFRFEYTTYPEGDTRTILRARIAAISRNGAGVVTDFGAHHEANVLDYLADLTPRVKEEYDPEKLGKQEFTAPIMAPVAGYDFITVREDAILHCAYLTWVTTKAMNDAHNEETISWELSRNSTIDGVRNILRDPDQPPDANHNNWLSYKKQEGWIFGTVKDPVAKTHPCMVPYAALPPYQKSKDMIFQAIVRAYFGVGEGYEQEDDEKAADSSGSTESQG